VTKPAQPTAAAVKAGFLLQAAGLCAWLFTADWRYAVAGLIALLVAAVVGAPTKRETS
jgi:hypothetical protein